MNNESKDVKKAILITAFDKLVPYIKSNLQKHNIELDTGYDTLNSLKVIKRTIKATGNTAFLRKAFARFINDTGFPYLIVMDYKINLDMDIADDPDWRKLLRTFLISYVIHSREEEYENLRGNFLLIARDEHIEEVKQFVSNPHDILVMLKTQNKEINKFLDQLMNDTESFNRLFHLESMSNVSSPEDVEKCIDSFKDDIDSLDNEEDEKLPEPEVKKILKAPVKKERVMKDAILAFITDDGKLYINNKPVDINKYKGYNRLTPEEFHIIGGWFAQNQFDITNTIQDAITNGIGAKKFYPPDEIILNLGKNCDVDSTIVSSLFKLFEKDLPDYKNIKINVNFGNALKLEQATGYNMIKKHVRHMY